MVRDICKQSMITNYYHWYSWISTKENIFSDGLSRNKLEVMKKLKHLKLQDRSKKAVKLAIQAYKEFVQASKEMTPANKQKESCKCNPEKICEVNEKCYESYIAQ